MLNITQAVGGPGVGLLWSRIADGKAADSARGRRQASVTLRPERVEGNHGRPSGGQRPLLRHLRRHWVSYAAEG